MVLTWPDGAAALSSTPLTQSTTTRRTLAYLPRVHTLVRHERVRRGCDGAVAAQRRRSDGAVAGQRQGVLRYMHMYVHAHAHVHVHAA